MPRRRQVPREFSVDVATKFCGFVDLLGVRSRLHDFDQALEFYFEASNAMRFVPDQLLSLNDMFTTTEGLKENGDPAFSYSIVSDSFIVSSEKVNWTIPTVFQVAQFAALSGIALRGAVSHGRHFERLEASHHFLLSEAFTRAYELESTIARVPRIILDPKRLELFEEIYKLDESARHTPWVLQCEDDLWCLNILPGNYDYAAIHGAMAPVDAGLASDLPDPVRQKLSWLGDYLNTVVWGRRGVYEEAAGHSISTLCHAERPGRVSGKNLETRRCG
jgi:hypothetical protein